MARLLAWVEERHGDVARYLVDAGGMDPELPDELRRLLVQTSAPR